MDNTNDNNTINPSEKTQLDPCACRRKGAKLEVYDWLSDIPESHDDTDLVEVRFKNTRKGYYRNTTHIKLAPGDLVAVEASPGRWGYSHWAFGLDTDEKEQCKDR